VAIYFNRRLDPEGYAKFIESHPEFNLRPQSSDPAHNIETIDSDQFIEEYYQNEEDNFISHVYRPKFPAPNCPWLLNLKTRFTYQERTSQIDYHLLNTVIQRFDHDVS